MTSLAAFLAWLLQAPRWFRVSETVRILLGEAVRVLLDPETGELRDLDEASIRAVERAAQTAEAGVSLAAWLLAHLLAGRSTPRTWRIARLCPSSHPPTPLELAARVFALCQRLESLQSHALALAHRLDLRAPRRPDSYPQAGEPDSPTRRDPSRGARGLTQVHSVEANFSPFGRTQHAQQASSLSCSAITACGQTGPPVLRAHHT